VAALAVVLSSLIIGVAGPVETARAAGGGVVDLAGSVPATFTVTPGVEQATVTNGPVRAPLTLVDGATLERIVTLYTDDLGQLTFQYVPSDFLVFDPQTQGVLPTTDGGTVKPGLYRIVSEGIPGQPFAGPVEASDPFNVQSTDDHPPTSLYDQTLPFVATKVAGGVADGHTDEEGYGYLDVRDGVKLSVNVRLPDPALYGPGPYPTVIQYSGYEPSKPGTPDGADAGGMLAGVLGYAYVGVNVRGSGCSGGVFDVFNGAEAADGYDIVEAVARQPWVKNGKPGMIGISYSGITQMYVASTQPPHLAAITPMSIIEDPWDQQWPGGIYNAGFTKQWLANRDDEAAGGAPWVKNRVIGGDTTCADNLKLRSQNIPFEAFGRALVHRPAEADARNLSILSRKINVPVHLSGAWQDEQTGARFGVLLDDLVSVPAGEKKLALYNGHHPDGLSPLIMTRWFEFLSFYVDHTIPKVNNLVRAFSDPEFTAIFGVPGNTFEPDRFFQFGTNTPIYGDYAGSVAAYQGEQPVRVLMEVGANPNYVATFPGAHRQRYAMTFPSWPPPDSSPRTWYFGANSSLVDTAPVADETDRFQYEPTVLASHYNVGGDFLRPQVSNNWKATNDGKGLEFISAPLNEQMTIAGEGYVNLWVRSTAPATPLEVVLSEVYADPDPNDAIPPEEVRVQNGLLSTNFRTLDPVRSTAMLKEHLFDAAHDQPMPAGQFVNIQVPILSVAHPFRAGSRIRVEVNTAGGDLPYWDFEYPDLNAATNDVALGGAMPSSLVLPVLPNTAFRRIPDTFAPQSAHPPCDSLRGQPCRAYKPLVNQVVAQEPPTTTTTTQPSTTTTTEPVATTTVLTSTTPPLQLPPTSAAVAANAVGTLPSTGSDPWPLVLVAVGLVAAGSALVLRARRRTG
jgi:LPXTG-motif cell wall-anchored protein